MAWKSPCPRYWPPWSTSGWRRTAPASPPLGKPCIEFDKGSAIAYLLDYFHIDKDNAYAFGDGYNDQAMFREVGHGIAMGNAVDVLKEKATYITDNFDQEGILKALYHEKVLDEK